MAWDSIPKAGITESIVSFTDKFIILCIVCFYSLYGSPVGFPDDCEVVWSGCERRAVKKNDHTIECKTNAMVG